MVHMNTEKIQSEFQIVGSRIVKFNLKNDFALLERDTKKRLADASYELGSITEFEDKIFGIVNLYIKVDAKNKLKQKLSLNLIIEGCFTVSKGTEIEKFKNMLGINGCTALYSIARSFIISVTSQALAGGEIILPMINTFKLIEQGEKTTDTKNK